MLCFFLFPILLLTAELIQMDDKSLTRVGGEHARDYTEIPSQLNSL